MMYFFELIESVFGSYYALLCINSLSLLSKITLFAFLVRQLSTRSRSWLCILFLIILTGGAFSDTAWIIKLLSLTMFPNIDYRLILFWIRISWAFSIIQHHSLCLFIESLTLKKDQVNLHQYIFGLLSIALSASFFYLAVSYPDTFELALDNRLQRITSFYLLILLMPCSLAFTFYQLRQRKLPRILHKQFKILIQGLIIPQAVSEFLQIYPIKQLYPETIANSFAVVGFSTITCTLALYFCARKIMGLRFLNASSHVQSAVKITFINDFKKTLTQLSQVTNIKELHHITQHFFKDILHIPLSKTKLYIRPTQTEVLLGATVDENSIMPLVETFFSTNEQGVMASTLFEDRIAIYDEIDFSNFYEQTIYRTQMLKLLDAINADVLLPIYEKDHLIAYIVIEKNARYPDLYTSGDRDEMIVFVNYLGNIINLLQNKSFETLIAQEKRIKEELYHRHQEINQYKESIRSFLRADNQKEIGIIFYKNRQFTLANQAAKELVEININQQEGHPLSKALKHIASTVQNYKAPQSCFAKDSAGNTLVITAVPHLEQNNVIITVAPPRVSDIIKKELDLLKDPSEWDYLLYLETTKNGQLINQLIPGSGEKLLNFKIEFLKLALSRRAVLLDVPAQDLLPMSNLLHTISMRSKFHVLNINSPSENFDIAVKLFGLNPLFGSALSTEAAFLAALNNVGTLLITNIHWLDLETQEYLADFIKYGMYKIFKSEQKVESNVRIICSSDKNLHQLVQDKLFSQSLYDQLKNSTLVMPSLMTIAETELEELALGFTEQSVKNSAFSNVLMLNDRQKAKLSYKRPTSLQDLKERVHDALHEKVQHNETFQEALFNPALSVSDPDLMQAARLGRQSLKDSKIMQMLWVKFHKNQNQIATFLGVNRSSISRRVKEYNLH